MLRRVLSALAALVTLLVFFPALLAAPATAATPTAAVAGVDVAFTLDPSVVVQLVVAFVLPVLVGLVTTTVTSAAVKAWLLAGLTLLTSVLVELGRAIADGATFDLGVALLLALPAFVISVASHYGLWKPTGVSGAVQAVGAPKHRA
jgi:hypothetical protein